MSNPFMPGGGGGEPARIDPLAGSISISMPATTTTVVRPLETASHIKTNRLKEIASKCDLVGIVWLFARVLFVAFILFGAIAWNEIQKLMSTTAKLIGKSTAIPFVLCAPGEGSKVNLDPSANNGGSVSMDAEYKYDEGGCMHPAFLLNLVFVAVSFSALLICIFAVCAPYMVRRNRRNGNAKPSFSRGVVVGIGFVGALLLFQGGWAIAAVANILDAYYKQTLAVYDLAAKGTTLLPEGFSAVAAGQTWPLYTAGFVGMGAALCTLLEAGLGMARQPSEAK